MSRRYHVITLVSRETGAKGATYRYPEDAWTREDAEADARREAGWDRDIIYAGTEIA